ncbi:MAG: hypothetical protein MJZ59_05595 [Paludibacteraceae bacterium]|nr:hypothetical protein [Paludibacteraceae bacterium]
MKNSKVLYSIFLGIACIFLVYVCIDSVVTPIRFEQKRTEREVLVVKNLVNIRAAEAEYKLINGRYQGDLDSLVLFLQNTPKKEVMKEGSLTDKQLEAGLTELKATRILEKALAKAAAKLKIDDKDQLYAYIWENDRDVQSNGLSGFRRDTIYKNMIETLYKGEYTAENIDQITYIPYTNKLRFETEVNNDYTTSQGIKVPLIEVRAHYNTYLADLDNQERVNLIDKETKLEHYPGLKIGSIEAPNNNAGNWE